MAMPTHYPTGSRMLTVRPTPMATSKGWRCDWAKSKPTGMLTQTDLR